MSKTYRSWDPDQAYLLPPSPQDWLPEGDLVYFVLDTVRDYEFKERRTGVYDAMREILKAKQGSAS